MHFFAQVNYQPEGSDRTSTERLERKLTRRPPRSPRPRPRPRLRLRPPPRAGTR